MTMIKLVIMIWELIVSTTIISMIGSISLLTDKTLQNTPNHGKT